MLECVLFTSGGFDVIEFCLFQKVLFALCTLNALATAVCLVAAALRYLQIFSTRQPCMVRNHGKYGKKIMYFDDLVLGQCVA